MKIRPWRLAATMALAVCLLATPPAQAASAWDVATLHKERPAWEGFGVGTMVQYRVTTTRGARGTEDTSADSQSTEVKETLRKMTATSFEIAKARKTATGWMPATTYSISRRKVAPKIVIKADGIEKIRVGETEYPCRKLNVTTTRVSAEGEETVETSTLWEHEEHGILKSESKRERPTIVTVTKLTVRRRVGTQELTCRAFRIQSGQQSGTYLLCPQVPGRLVESSLEFESGGSRRIDKVLVAFVKK
jgi:hypothetical protein